MCCFSLAFLFILTVLTTLASVDLFLSLFFVIILQDLFSILPASFSLLLKLHFSLLPGSGNLQHFNLLSAILSFDLVEHDERTFPLSAGMLRTIVTFRLHKSLINPFLSLNEIVNYN